MSMEDKLCFRLDEEEEEGEPEGEGDDSLLYGELLQLQEKGLERLSYTTSLNTPMWPLRKSIKAKANGSTKACRHTSAGSAPVRSSQGPVCISVLTLCPTWSALISEIAR